MQTTCTLLQTDITHYSIFTGQMLFLTPNQQCQSAEGIVIIIVIKIYIVPVFSLGQQLTAAH